MSAPGRPALAGPWQGLLCKEGPLRRSFFPPAAQPVGLCKPAGGAKGEPTFIVVSKVLHGDPCEGAKFASSGTSSNTDLSLDWLVFYQ
jgi:hypothetical protein